MEFKVFFLYFVNLDISDSVLVARGFFFQKHFMCSENIASGVLEKKNRRLMGIHTWIKYHQ